MAAGAEDLIVEIVGEAAPRQVKELTDALVRLNVVFDEINAKAKGGIGGGGTTNLAQLAENANKYNIALNGIAQASQQAATAAAPLKAAMSGLDGDLKKNYEGWINNKIAIAQHKEAIISLTDSMARFEKQGASNSAAYRQLNDARTQEVAGLKAAEVNAKNYNKVIVDSIDVEKKASQQKAFNRQLDIASAREGIALQKEVDRQTKLSKAQRLALEIAEREELIAIQKAVTAAEKVQLAERLAAEEVAIAQHNARIEAMNITDVKGGSAKNAIVESTAGLRGIYGVIRQIAYILPGIGIAGIFNLAFEAIEKVWDSLSKTNTQVKQFTINEQQAAEYGKRIAEAYGDESAKLVILKDKIENVNVPMHVRLQGIKDIQRQFPDYFGQLKKEEILIGNVGDAYKKASDAILANSRLRIYGEDLGKVSTQLVRTEDRINSVSASDRKNVGLYKDDKGYYQSTSDFAYTNTTGNLYGNKLVPTGEVDKNGKPIWSTLLDEVKKYNAALDTQYGLLAKIHEVTPQATTDVTHKESKAPKGPKDRSADIALNNLIKQAEDEAAIQKSISEDESKSLDDRLAHYQLYTDALIKAARLKGQKEKETEKTINADIAVIKQKQYEGEIKMRRGAESANNVARIVADEEAEINAIYKQKGAERLKEITDNLTGIAEKVSESHRAEKDALRAQYDDGKITYQQYRKEFAKIQGAEDNETLDKQKEYTKRALSELLKEAGIPADVILAVQKKLDTQYDKPAKNDAGSFAFGISETQLGNAEKFAAKGETLAHSLATLNTNLTQRRVNEIDQEIAKINERRDAELKAAQARGASEQELSDITARAAAKTLELEDKKHKQLQKSAQFEKSVTIAQIIVETALATVRALGSKPYTPANIALAAATAAIGAANLAVAISAPLPQYKMGTKDHPGGLAIVGDGGRREVIETQSGETFLTPAVPTVADLPKHAVVHKSVDDYIRESQRYSMGGIPVLGHVDDRMGTQALQNALSQQTSAIVNAVKQTPRTQVSITGDGITHLVSTGQSSIKFLHNLKYD